MIFAQCRGRRLAVLPLLIVAAGCVPATDARVRPAPVERPPLSQSPAPAATEAVRSPSVPAIRDFVLRGTSEQGGVMIGQAPEGAQALTLDGQTIPLTRNGAFLIAFDRDAGPVARLVAILADGRMIARDIVVAAGRWRLEQINAPYRGSASSDADFERRRPAELAQIAAARNAAVVSDGWKQRFRWPVTGRLSGLFGAQRVYQGKPGPYHSGTDIAVPAGTPFVAPADGVVVLAANAPFTLEGNLLIVDHGMGLTSAFLHCQRLDVKVGDRVAQGQALGTVGRTGRATGPHMHWGLKWRDARLDPAKLAGPMSR